MTGSVAGRHETARLEAFSDGVFAIAITILALELRVPQLEEITSGNLITAVLHQWPSYFAFVLSFTTILILWILHYARLAFVERIDGLLMFGNGLLLMTIVALSYPTALVGEYLNTPAGEAAVATYGLVVLGMCAAWNIFLLALRPERGLLKPGVPPELIASARRRVALGFVIYLVATGLALVNAYLGLGIITAMWWFWAVIAYRTLKGREPLSADASSRGGRRRLRRVNSDGLVPRPSLKRRPRQSEQSSGSVPGSGTPGRAAHHARSPRDGSGDGAPSGAPGLRTQPRRFEQANAVLHLRG